MKGYRIRLIRHGMTDANLSGVYIGSTDQPLCEAGKQELLEKKAAGRYSPVQRVYTSPLSRCVMTGEILFPGDKPAVIDDLREMDFGIFEGMNVKDLMDLPEYKEFLKGGLDNAAPGGETLRRVVERSFSGISAVIDDMMKNGFTLAAVITHGGIIMNLLSCFGVPKMPPMQFPSDFGEGYEILVTADMWMRSQAFEILGRI